MWVGALLLNLVAVTLSPEILSQLRRLRASYDSSLVLLFSLSAIACGPDLLVRCRPRAGRFQIEKRQMGARQPGLAGMARGQNATDGFYSITGIG
jgi:hypothetical protein